MSAGSEFTGSIEDVDQEQARPEVPTALPAVPVQVDGPVQVHQLGSRSAASRSRRLADTDGAVKVFNADDRRRHLTLLSTDLDFFYDTDQAGVVAEVSALWLAGVPLPITHKEEIWVKVAAAGTTTLSIIAENWAD